MPAVDFHKTDYSKLKDFKPGASKKKDLWIKMRPSDTGQDKRYTVRLLPWKDIPFHSTNVHYLRHSNGLLITECPGKDCPACRVFFRNRNLVSEGAEFDALKKLQPQTRVFANVLLRAVDKEEIDPALQFPQIWSMTYRVSMMLKDELTNSAEEGIYLDDVTDGRDLVVKVIKRGPSFMVDTISVKPKSTPVQNVEELELNDLEFFASQNKATPEEIENILPAVLGEFYDDFAKDEFVNEKVEGVPF